MPNADAQALQAKFEADVHEGKVRIQIKSGVSGLSAVFWHASHGTDLGVP